MAIDKTIVYTILQGWIFRLQKNREKIDLLFSCLILRICNAIIPENTKKCKSKLDFLLQMWILDYKVGFSFAKIDFHFQNKTFVVQTGVLIYYSPWNSK